MAFMLDPYTCKSQLSCPFSKASAAKQFPLRNIAVAALLLLQNSNHGCIPAGGLSSLLIPHIFGRPLGRSGSNSPANQDSRIPALPLRPDSQTATVAASSLGQVKLGRYRSGTSPLVSATSGRPMQWGFGNNSALPNAAGSDRPKQTFELPALSKGPITSSAVNRAQGLGRYQQQGVQQPSSNLSSYKSRQLFGRQNLM